MVKEGLMSIKMDIISDHGLTKLWMGCIHKTMAHVGPIGVGETFLTFKTVPKHQKYLRLVSAD